MVNGKVTTVEYDVECIVSERASIVDLCGKRMRSRVGSIESAAARELVEIRIRHFRPDTAGISRNDRQVNAGQVGTFDIAIDHCPAPIVSCLIPKCGDFVVEYIVIARQSEAIMAVNVLSRGRKAMTCLGFQVFIAVYFEDIRHIEVGISLFERRCTEPSRIRTAQLQTP